MATIIDNAPTSITIPRDDCVDVLIVAHNDDHHDPVLGTVTFLVGDQQVQVQATLQGADSSPVVYGEAVLSPDLVAAGVFVENHGNGNYLVCGPDFDLALHTH
jgi:hypothetical protein